MGRLYCVNRFLSDLSDVVRGFPAVRFLLHEQLFGWRFPYFLLCVDVLQQFFVESHVSALHVGFLITSQLYHDVACDELMVAIYVRVGDVTF